MSIALNKMSADITQADRVSRRLQVWLWKNADETKKIIAGRVDCPSTLVREIVTNTELCLSWLSVQRSSKKSFYAARSLNNQSINEALCHQKALPIELAKELAENAQGKAAWELLLRKDIGHVLRAKLVIGSVVKTHQALPLTVDDLAERVGPELSVWLAIIDKTSDPLLLNAALQSCPNEPYIHRLVIDALFRIEENLIGKVVRIKQFAAQYPEDSVENAAERIIGMLLESPLLPIRELHRLQGLRASSSRLKNIQIRISWQTALESNTFNCSYNSLPTASNNHCEMLKELVSERRLTQLFATRLADEICCHLDEIDRATVGLVLAACGDQIAERLTRSALENGDRELLAALGQYTSLVALELMSDDFPLAPLLEAVPLSALPEKFINNYGKKIVNEAPLISPLLSVPGLVSALLAELADLAHGTRITATALIAEWQGDLKSLIKTSALL